MAFSVIFSYVLIKYTSGLLAKIITALAALGIIIHEFSHLLMCVITHTPIENVKLLKKVKNEKSDEVGYMGIVNVRKHNISFLQGFLISFAPLYLSFWFFFYLLDFLIGNQVTPLIFFICIFTMISLVLSAAPSFVDLGIILEAFRNDTHHSLYQILLISLSVLTTWIITFSCNIQFIHEIFIYLVIAGFYFIFKYGFKMTRYILHSINQNWFDNIRQPKKMRFKTFTRRHYKPKKYD
ncbi:MAG: hypothetical protein ACFFCL_06520 [Promethearchaeota archaeon]